MDKEANTSHYGRITQVECVRGLGALVVAFAHINTPLLMFPPWVAYVFRAVPYGGTALVMFFVMSGLVLGLSLDRAKALPFGRRYGQFVWRRIWRMYPAHLASLALIIPLGVHVLRNWHAADMSQYPFVSRLWLIVFNGANFYDLRRTTLVANALLVQNLYNPVTWSLRVEMIFAFLLPWLHWTARRRSVWLHTALLSASIVPLCFWDRPVFRAEVPLALLPAFYLGLLLPQWGPAWARRVARLRWPDAVLLASGVLLALPRKLWLPDTSSLQDCAEAFLGAHVLALLVWGPRCRTIELLEHRWVHWTGRVSYSFYLWHWTVVLCMQRILFTTFTFPDDPLHSVLCFTGLFVSSVAVALLLGYLTHRFVEVQGIRVGNILWGRLASRAAAPEETS